MPKKIRWNRDTDGIVTIVGPRMPRILFTGGRGWQSLAGSQCIVTIFRTRMPRLLSTEGGGMAKIGLGELVGIEVYVELSQFSVQEYPASFVRVERGLMSKFNQQD